MFIRTEKALEAIYVCCFGKKDQIEEEDSRLLSIILNAVFPTVGESAISEIISTKAKQVADGKNTSFPDPKPLSKEAIQLQMKDLEFLKQKSEN